MDIVSLQGATYAKDDMDRAVAAHFKELTLEERIKPGDRVLIKPNLLMKRKPEDFTTTHPALVAAIVRRLKAMGVTNIIIGDSPGGPFTVSSLQSIYEACGMAEVAREEGVGLNTNTAAQTVPSAGGKAARELDIITAALEADVIINVCKLKGHGMMTLSGAVKNLFGCVPGLTKPEYHYRYPSLTDFAEMLVDLCETVKATVHFVDGVEAMEGDGPSGGSKRELGWTFAGMNPYAVDRVLCHHIGYLVEAVPVLCAALCRGICPASMDEIKMVGDVFIPVQDFVMPTGKELDFTAKLPKLIQKPAQKVLSGIITPKPDVRLLDCIGCGKCAESCPAHTIDIRERKAYIRYKDCIRCYCCHEMCPVRAIDLKRSWITRIKREERV